MSSAELDLLYESWQACGNRDTVGQGAQIKAARLLTAARHPEFWPWFSSALLNEKRKWFVAAFFRKYPVPKRLFREMIRAGVQETYPSTIWPFINPCVISYDHKRVCIELIPYLESGTDGEKAAAAIALDWAQYEKASVKILKQVRRQLLIEFINNPDLQVRRSIIPQLELTRLAYPIRLWHLVPKAIAIASSHPDEFIRGFVGSNRRN